MPDQILALIVFLFPLAYSPGPGNLFFAANGARFGLRATVPASLGYHLATWLVTVVAGAGVARGMEAAPGLFAALRWAGGLYVLWLAARVLRAGAAGTGPAARPAGVRDGALLMLLNPKAYLILGLMFSQFLGPGAPLGAILWIATVFTLNNLIAFSLWTVAGDAIAARFRDAREARRLNALFGTVLAAVGIWMLMG